MFLAVTGGEALYADMGHFGRSPIRRGWFMIVLAGAGAELLRPGRAAAGRIRSAIANPFYLLAPSWLLPFLIVLATCATVIASQAVISGVFSITRQALNLGYLPRLRVAAFLGRRDRPGVCAVGELAAVRRHADADPHLPAPRARWPARTASRSRARC